MRLSKEKRKEIIQLLRDQYQDMAKVVDNDIKLLEKKEMVAKQTFKERITQLRTDNNFTYQEMGKMIGISHAMVEEMEKIPQGDEDKKREAYNSFTIDKFYLEAYSLIFRVSPSYLLGEVEKPYIYAIDPMEVPDIETERTVKFIISSLYGDGYKQELLDTFCEISSKSYRLINEIKETTKMLPIVKSLPFPELECDWFAFHIAHPNDSEKIAHYSSNLCEFARRDREFVKLMAKISANDMIVIKVYNILKDSGYLERKKDIGEND